MELATQLNQSLPIKVTIEDVERNPQFAKLLEKIATQHLDKDGLLRRQSQELETLKITLKSAKTQFFQKKIILEEVKSVLSDAMSNAEIDPLSPEASELYRRLDRLLNVAQTEHALNISQHPTDNTLNVLDISPDFMNRTQFEAHGPEYMEEIHSFFKVKIVPDMHKRLLARHRELAQFFDPVNMDNETTGIHGGMNMTTRTMLERPDHSVSQYQFNEMTNIDPSVDLSDLVKGHLHQIENQSIILTETIQSLETQTWFFYKQLVHCLQKLGQILEEHKLLHAKDSFKMNLEWKREKIRTMLMKLEVIKFQYLTETYDSETVLSLRKLRAMLERQYQEIQNESFIVDNKLEQYRRIGGEFDALVEEYRHILVEIENSYNFLDKLQNHT